MHPVSINDIIHTASDIARINRDISLALLHLAKAMPARSVAAQLRVYAEAAESLSNKAISIHDIAQSETDSSS